MRGRSSTGGVSQRKVTAMEVDDWGISGTKNAGWEESRDQHDQT